MRVLFIGKGVSNDGAIKVAIQYKIDYDYINVNEEAQNDYDVIVKGPGISYDEAIIKKYTNLNKLIITDIEFVSWFLNEYLIGITGSNGKTTTTSLINEILNKQYKSIACGNIGYSIGDAFYNSKDTTHYVLELSSFELKGTYLFKPNIAIITNLNCCHLDYHKTFEDYLLSKKKLIVNQSNNDFLIYNLDCINTINIVKDSVARKYSFSLNNEYADCYLKNNIIYLFDTEFININLLPEDNISTLGNYLAAILTAFILKIEKENIVDSLINFKKANYRFEYIKENVINDAKSTNVYSTISAIKSINNNIILLCGGLYRNYELNQLDDYLDNIELVISYGETNQLLKEYFNKKGIICIKCDSFESAVQASLNNLSSNNTLLFSPMFASYDMFKSYEQRGEQFNKLIKSYY